ncbi:MAG TPA: hypothetical protein DCZ92_04925 [Elusimicrobia bacterium]|nr:MAG: hypothetical protein A2016_07450 [Elusimicrobia bacterium GWF2_62_30]HBA60150.1 hypothetical protein [Elusimicrobiota bacterium]
MKKLLAMTLAATALFATRVSAADNLDEKYFTVDENSMVIQEITNKGGSLDGELPKPPTNPQIGGSTDTGNAGNNGTGGISFDDVNGTIGVIDNIVNLMDKIFTLIAKNQPVVNIKVDYANAVPYGTSHWTQLQGWSRPSTKKYAFTMENLYGMEVVKVVYQVHWTHSGNYQGKGKFLTGVTVEPLSVSTAWGYNVDLTAEVPDSTVANVGTTADPVASMQVQLKWKVHTIVKDIQEKDIFYVQGDGMMQPLSKAYSRGIEKQNQKDMEVLKKELSDVKFN